MMISQERVAESFSLVGSGNAHNEPQSSDEHLVAVNRNKLCLPPDRLPQDKQAVNCQMSKSTTKNRDGLQMPDVITVRPTGGVFKLPKLGIGMIFPPGAVNSDTKLQISILDICCNPSKDRDNNQGVSWASITPLVRIQPTEVSYSKPVYLVINHNMILSPETFRDGSQPVMLHREHDQTEWQIIPVAGEVHVDSVHRDFPLCHYKEAVFTDKDVIIQMYTNCEQCAFFDVTNDLGVTLRAFRMTVLVYADYHPAGQALNIRVFALHGTQDREKIVIEQQRRDGGHSLGATVVDVAHTDTPISIDLKISAGERRIVMQQKIQRARFEEELDHRSTRVPPSASFPVLLAPSDASNVPNNIRIEVSAYQCSNEHETVDTFQDLIGLRRSVPNETTIRPYASTLSVEESQPSQNYTTVRQCLKELLTADEREKVKHSLSVVSPTDDFEIILDTFINDGDPQTVIGKLERAGVRNPELEESLKRLI